MAEAARKRAVKPAPGHGEICNVNGENIDRLEFAVFGDGNGNPGIIRRIDGLELSVRFLRKQSWAVITLLTAVLGSVIYSILRP